MQRKLTVVLGAAVLWVSFQVPARSQDRPADMSNFSAYRPGLIERSGVGGVSVFGGVYRVVRNVPATLAYVKVQSENSVAIGYAIFDKEQKSKDFPNGFLGFCEYSFLKYDSRKSVPLSDLEGVHQFATAKILTEKFKGNAIIEKNRTQHLSFWADYAGLYRTSAKGGAFTRVGVTTISAVSGTYIVVKHCEVEREPKLLDFMKSAVSDVINVQK